MISHVDIPLPRHSGSNQAIKIVADAVHDYDHDIFFQPGNRKERKQMLRNIALGQQPSNVTRLSLRLRNAVPVSHLPDPQHIRRTLSQKANLKENIPFSPERKVPYVLSVRATTDEAKLAVIAGKLDFRAIDAEFDDAPIRISSDICLWDTGAHHCIISSDLLPTEFIQSSIHDPYRNEDQTTLQVDAVFAFSGSSFAITTIFHVLPLSTIPNQRSGVILGQSAFIDRLVYKSIPKIILESRGETVEDDCWGEIEVETAIDIYGYVVYGS